MKTTCTVEMLASGCVTVHVSPLLNCSAEQPATAAKVRLSLAPKLTQPESAAESKRPATFGPHPSGDSAVTFSTPAPSSVMRE